MYREFVGSLGQLGVRGLGSIGFSVYRVEEWSQGFRALGLWGV